ncbi:MAG: ABC transporter permease [Ruminococcaceae bacterium]|nr:ABC transporter permease [Oscillospiraceae bacterium]
MTSKTMKKHREPWLVISKRDDLVWWKAWLIRVATILVGILVVGILSMTLTGGGFAKIYSTMFRGAFGRLLEGNLMMVWPFFQKTAILLCLSLAVAPAFRMKFWNCGAEGQALIGGLASMVCMMKLGGTVSEWLLVPIVIISSIAAGAVWGLVPAIFKAHYNTNETLFTLMMNYVATQLVLYYINISSGGSQVIQPVLTGALPVIGNQKYLLNILIVIVLTVAMFIYLKYSKHGYEIAVVGESHNTARYVGINVKTVMMRTMLISGALCGVAGMLLVAGTDHSINENTVGGQGFTAIMIAWLGQLNPFVMALMSALVIFLQLGTAKVANDAFISDALSGIAVGIVILMLVGCEFFIRYSVKIRRNRKEGKA